MAEQGKTSERETGVLAGLKALLELEEEYQEPWVGYTKFSDIVEESHFHNRAHSSWIGNKVVEACQNHVTWLHAVKVLDEHNVVLSTSDVPPAHRADVEKLKALINELEADKDGEWIPRANERVDRRCPECELVTDGGGCSLLPGIPGIAAKCVFAKAHDPLAPHWPEWEDLSKEEQEVWTSINETAVGLTHPPTRTYVNDYELYEAFCELTTLVPSRNPARSFVRYSKDRNHALVIDSDGNAGLYEVGEAGYADRLAVFDQDECSRDGMQIMLDGKCDVVRDEGVRVGKKRKKR